MKFLEINSDPHNRAQLDVQIRVPIKFALDHERVSVNEAVFLLTRILAELAGPDLVTGHFLAAYRNKELDADPPPNILNTQPSNSQPNC